MLFFFPFKKAGNLILTLQTFYQQMQSGTATFMLMPAFCDVPLDRQVKV